MTFTESISSCFTKYATFEGTASRSEYWWFYLFSLLAAMILSVVSEAAVIVFWLATLLPSLAVGVRRLHDTDRSGWYMLLSLVPLIGLIVIVFLIQKTRPNRFSTPSVASTPAPDPIQEAAPAPEGTTTPQ
jgi:uncharacterized membrane protein YhaH (DUF805 family)